MTYQEFNEKNKYYLVESSPGLEIKDSDIIDFWDCKFQELTTIPNFKYSQIKIKFGTARFYARPRSFDVSDIEKEIDKILLNKSH